MNHNETVKSTVEELIGAPTIARFNGLGDDKVQQIVEYTKRTVAAHSEAPYETIVEIIMKVSSTVSLRSDNESVENVKGCIEALVKVAVQKAVDANQLSVLENALFVYMGLIKSEDKKFKPTWPLSGFLVVLDKMLSDGKFHLPRSTMESLKAFFSRPHSVFDINKEETNRIKKTLGIM